MLDKFKNILTSIKDWFVAKGESKNTSNSSTYKWLISLFVGALSLIGLAYAAWVQYKQGKELAKLKHEKDLAEQVLIREKLDARVNVEEDKSKDLEQKVKLSEIKLIEIDHNLTKAKDDHEQISNEIKAIDNWDAADSFNKSH